MLKLALLLPFALGLWNLTHSVIVFLAALGGAILTLGYFARKAQLLRRKLKRRWQEISVHIREQRQVRDVVLGSGSTLGVDERLRQIVVRQEQTDAKLDQVAAELNGKPEGIRDQLQQIQEHIGLIAVTDKARIKDAIAGDERSPVDRRDTAA